MTIYKISKNDFDSFTVTTNPFRQYISSSAGTVGSVNVFARRSKNEKESSPLSSFIEATKDDSDLATSLKNIVNIAKNNKDFRRHLDFYFKKLKQQGPSARKNKILDIIRFTPSVGFTSNTLRKLLVKDTLSQYYRTTYPSAHWAYTNYNSINFFTASSVPPGSAILYPNKLGGPVHEGYVGGIYTPSGAFSFDFYINPRYKPDANGGVYKAGTIFHLSSCYAVSIISGSAKDGNNKPSGFRLQLQLSHSADILPSLAKPGTIVTNEDLVFRSNDNSLKWNNWHHCVIRWGTNAINKGTGSFNIDGVDQGFFVIPSGTITPLDNGGINRPGILSVGNYYEGKNQGNSVQTLFFSQDPALRDGLFELDNTPSYDEPDYYKFDHCLNGEFHDLAIKRYYMTDNDILDSSSFGPTDIDSDKIAFYLPPFFTSKSPFRQNVGGTGGILQTPFFEIDGTTDDPFNVALSFGVNGHYINIENFLRDFANDLYPRLHRMTGSAITTTTDARSANDFLYEQEQIRRRNLLIMPCDDGLFVPNFDLLGKEISKLSYFDDLNLEELSFVHLDELISTASVIFQPIYDPLQESLVGQSNNTFVEQQIGPSPEKPAFVNGPAYTTYINSIKKAIADGTFDASLQMNAPLTIYQRTRDPSSNQVTFFDISNLYYGNRIMPKSFTMTDYSLSGSNKVVSVTLKDNGNGTIYRADCFSSQSSWNSVGTIFYDEGIVAIKSPHLYFFGKDGYEISFKGEQNIHVMKFDVMAPSNQLNSSSNPSYINALPSDISTDPEKEFVYITGLNFHDDNYNVIMKTQLAQPIIKRYGDRIQFRIKYDF